MPLPVKALLAFKVEPVKDSPVPKSTDCKFLPTSVITKEEAVKVAIFTLPKAETWNRLVPELEATVKGFKMPVPWTLKEIVEEVALTPANAPLSKIMELAVLDAPVARIR